MNEKTDFVLVKRPSSALKKVAPGAKRVLSGMVADALALAKKEQSVLAAAKFRIGDYEWCEPDYRQILIWAKALAIKPEKVIHQLLNGNRYNEPWQETQFYEGRLQKINWDDSLLPIKNLEWIEGLRTTHLSFCTTFLTKYPFIEEGNIQILKPALPQLTHLACPRLKMVSLNLSETPSLIDLRCDGNQLTQLDLSKNPQLEALCCSSNQISDLDFSEIKNLKSLSCYGNRIGALNLNTTPNLERLDCKFNSIEVLDIRLLVSIKELDFDRNKTRLIQRPDQHF